MKIHCVVLLAVACTLSACNRHTDSSSAPTSDAAAPKSQAADVSLSQAQIVHVHELVTLWSKKQGGDDAALPELQGMGMKGRDAVIRLLDDATLPNQEAAAAIEILNILFPGSESYAALDRFGSRISDPADRKMFLDIQQAFRKNVPSKQ